ncbi:MAG: type II toxin-antitoxin system VapC family toxin [Deltaproteobacteria bacterium]|nr:type II toxin-antitoxin system VapC family toxin [Deltaproteobacteria bacterium]MBW1815914.1 type II toxin-antitoxin system VapC family toxin [Deltaproteobacteria bacterium]MBW2285849.1 type II toxin-antitoxin system VapC family toxin [Deltaproteobacteria bacterium]
MYVLDTNTLIYFFKGVGNVADNILNTLPKDIGIPAIVLFELEVGIAKSKSPRKRIKQLHEMTSLIQIISFGDKEAIMSATIRADLEKKGTPIGPYDILIGGTTLAHQATLITHNTTEFGRIDKLHIEDWY